MKQILTLLICVLTQVLFAQSTGCTNEVLFSHSWVATAHSDIFTAEDNGTSNSDYYLEIIEKEVNQEGKTKITIGSYTHEIIKDPWNLTGDDFEVVDDVFFYNRYDIKKGIVVKVTYQLVGRTHRFNAYVVFAPQGGGCNYFGVAGPVVARE